MAKQTANDKFANIAEIKSRVIFLLLAIMVYRIGAHIPVPGIDVAKLAQLFSQERSILGFLNLFSGGSLSRLSLFAIGIMPYISSSIVVQLLSSVVPKLDQLKKEGSNGRKKISVYTRNLTVVLASFHALGMAKYLASSGVALETSFTYYFTVVVTLVTGTMFLMWLGEQITERGIGNGISMIIFAGIVSSLPSAIAMTFEKVRQGEILAISLLLLGLMVFAIIAFIVFIERGQRKIVVNHAARQQGNRMYAPQKNHLPLKINMAGVIPPIFASSIILFLGSLVKWSGKAMNSEWLTDISLSISPGQPMYILLYVVAIVFFCFFYTSLMFNPKETADNLKKSGAFLPGIRPGDNTAKYIDKVVTRLTMFGAAYITVLSLLPELLNLFMHVPFYFGGTSLLIVVVVVMEFMSQIQAKLMSHHYDSLMKRANFK